VLFVSFVVQSHDFRTRQTMDAATLRRTGFHNARELTWTLAWLRLCAVAGQALAVAVVAWGLKLPIPVEALAIGIGALLAFALAVFWRLRQRWPVTSLEAVAHIAVDIAALCWLLYLTGGVANPFVSLMVMPITLAATALPLRDVAIVTLLAAAGYLALIAWHIPLPDLHTAAAGVDLHVVGLAIDFVILAAALAFFVTRLARMLHARESEIQRERERALRDEGILAIATQAAGAAHELNTPLSTMRTLIAEMKREHTGEHGLADDLDLLGSQAERCRDILRELVAVGSRQLSGEPQRQGLAAFVQDCEARFHLLRPEIELSIAIEGDASDREIEAEPGLRHALINLLSNAADASLAAGSACVTLRVAADARQAEFGVRDFGSGTEAGLRARSAFQSSKQNGLGLGLALAHATAERLGGELRAEVQTDRGLLQRLRVPLRSRGV
jgi:two-component system sensor histidine kinase RegB